MTEEDYTPDPKQIDEFEKLSKKVENGNGKSTKKKSKRKSADEEEPQKRAIFIPRYTNEDSLLAEAVIIGGRPMFAMAMGGGISLQDAIELVADQTIIKPPERMSYMSKPYTFKSKEEFQDVVESVKAKNLDILYKKVKSIWQKYIDADDFHISLCTADTIFTYFQDKIGLTHYPFFVGGNDSGKSNNLTVIHFLAYRNMISSGMTAANIYQFLGSDSEGLGTICEDEADNIDEDHDKMRIYKNGYTTGIPVFRIDTSFGRKQLRFNTFGFKAFGAEKLPDSVSARGFNQRIVPLPCTYGFPQYDISEVVNAAGEEEYEQLLEELNTMRNVLFVYRLLHFKDKIPNIKLNIQNREKQLFKPVLRLFQNTETTLNELLPVVSKYVSQKRESNANTLHAYLYRLVSDLTKAQNTYEIESSLIWNTVRETLQGKDIPYKPQSYDTVEFGIISQKGTIETLIQVFGAKPSQNRRESRKLVFDKDKLQKLGKIYRLSINVKVGTAVTDVTDVGLDRHLNEQPDDNKMVDSDQESQNIDNKTTKDIENITSDQNDKCAEHSLQASQASHVSPKQKQEEHSCKVINVENTNEPYVKIDRSTKWGNPYRIGIHGTREEVIAKYEAYLFSNKELMGQLSELKGQNLGCWCAPLPCHGDLLLRLANDKNFKCFYCDNGFNDNVERVNHIDIEHPNKPHYPTEEAFRNRLER